MQIRSKRGGRMRAGPGWRHEALEPRRLLSVNVLTWHNDLTRQGLNSSEALLTPANVNQSTFGKLFSYPVQGQVYAQPLYVSNLSIGGGTHDVVFVATEHDMVYALNADSKSGTNGGVLWSRGLGTAAAMPNSYFGNRYGSYHDINPEVGITSTPVIDLANGTMYVDAFTNDSTGVYSHHIHALDITTGNDKVTPVLVSATYPGNGPEGNGTTLMFEATQQLQRPALTLLNGTLYVAYGSYADTDPYHGWVLGFNPSSLVLKSVFNTTPNYLTPAGSNPGEGAIWQAGAGLASDGSSLYFMTGNGDFDASIHDYGDSFLRLTTANGTLTVSDYFTPKNQQSLASADEDLGSGGAMLLPDSAGNTTHPHLLVGCGKQGLIYLVDRDSMGSYDPNTDHVVGEASLGQGTWSSPAYFNGEIYYHGVGGVLKAFAVSNAAISAGPVAQGSISFSNSATPSISSNGMANGVVWEIQGNSGTAVLHAYDATNLTELYNSSQDAARDQLGSYVKFTTPTIADGKVFVGTGSALAIFGLVAPPTQPPAAPSNLTAAALGSSQVKLQWVDNSNNESGFKIERSTDGASFTQIAMAGVNATNYTDSNLNPSTKYYYRVRATNIVGDSAYTSIASAMTAPPGTPVYWYRFDEGSGTTTADAVGGNTGTLIGNTLPKWAPGRIGPDALSFSGDGISKQTTSESAVRTANELEPVLGATATLTAWIKTTQVGNNTLWAAPAITGVEQASAASDIRWGYLDASGHIGVGAGNGPGALSTNPVNDGTWHHVAFTRDATTGLVQVYVDGVLNSSMTNDTGQETSHFSLIGAQSDVAADGSTSQGATYFNGQLDDVRIYNQVLSANQVASLGEVPPAPGGLSATVVSGSVVHLSWGNVAPYASGVLIERKADSGGTYGQIAQLPPGSTTYDDSGLTQGVQYFYRIRAIDDAGASPYSSEVSATTPMAAVIGRYLFYNNSSFDGQNGSSNTADDRAIDAARQPLLAGGTASFANVTGYSKGINGIMIDVANLAGVPDISDFVFEVGSGSAGPSWSPAPAPTFVTAYPGRGQAAATRIEIIWPDGSIKNEWLRVTMQANSNTGLASPDVFYWGSLVGASAGTVAGGQFVVTSADELAARDDPHGLANRALVGNVHDYNKDGKVDAVDQLIARYSMNNALAVLAAQPALAAAAPLTPAFSPSASGFDDLLTLARHYRKARSPGELPMLARRR